METEMVIEPLKDRLKRLRLERLMSQRELAVPGVSYAYISRIEAGTRQPSVRAIRKLAERLEVTPEYLETGIEPLDYEAELDLLRYDLADRDNIIEALMENEIFRNTYYRYIFACGCCFDTTESLMRNNDSPPLCPVHGEVSYSVLKAYYACGCYFRAKGVAPPNCPVHSKEMTNWSFSLGWEQKGIILNADKSTEEKESSEGSEISNREAA